MTIPELCLLNFCCFPKRLASVKYTTMVGLNSGFPAFILQVLQCKRNYGLFCVYSECTCVDVMYCVLVGSRAYHLEKHKTYKTIFVEKMST